MEIKQETVCEDTLCLMREYYHLNAEPLFSVLTDDCVWLSVGNLLVSGAEAIKAQFKNGFLMPSFELEEPVFREIATGSEEQLMVLGEYVLHPSKGAEVICTTKQRLTFCYRKVGEESFRLYHMHVSNEYSELVGDEVFPVQVSRETYRYVQSLLKENGKNSSPKLTVKTGTSINFVDASLILYIQALERESILHLLHENRWVKNSIRELETQLPSQFYRLHRSYFVNCDYVAKLERYKLTLITGEELPVPKMRYTQIRDEILEIMKKK